MSVKYNFNTEIKDIRRSECLNAAIEITKAYAGSSSERKVTFSDVIQSVYKTLNEISSKLKD